MTATPSEPGMSSRATGSRVPLFGVLGRDRAVRHREQRRRDRRAVAGARADRQRVARRTRRRGRDRPDRVLRGLRRRADRPDRAAPHRLIADVLSALAVAAIPIADLTRRPRRCRCCWRSSRSVPSSTARAPPRGSRCDRTSRGPPVCPLTKVNAWGEAADGIGYLAGPGLAGLLLAAGRRLRHALDLGRAVRGVAVLLTALTVPAHLSPTPRPEPYLRSVVDGLRARAARPDAAGGDPDGGGAHGVRAAVRVGRA